MFAKVPKRGINILLVASIVGLGNYSYIPIAYAESTNAVQENQSENTLSKLEIEGIQLDRDFTTEVKEYSTTVENETREMNLLVESSNPDASITINDTSIKSGVVSTFSLQTGENKFLITVSDGTHQLNTYTVTVTRKQNGNNLLQNIELSNGKLSPNFSSEINKYSIEVANYIASLTIKPTSVESTSTIQVNGTSLKEGRVSVDLPIGKSIITIVVTAENGEKKTYTINVARGNSTNSQTTIPTQNNRTNTFQPTMNQQGNTTTTAQKVSKATLSSLTINNGTWDSAFTSDEFTYHVAVSSDVDSITLSPTARYSSSTILIEGGTSKTIKLDNDNKTVISIVVRYSDDDRKTYVLVIDREE
ncbi:cadherin-like beta sandwich domain-containing protein [Neobacillus rhizosphaerae]|uniref:cadherin-like beta sandwich domain-containing protein n=1 Tax=Neobacillus rhizosphaerae TaxID=2880965 RepID=UPI003D2AEA09